MLLPSVASSNLGLFGNRRAMVASICHSLVSCLNFFFFFGAQGKKSNWIFILCEPQVLLTLSPLEHASYMSVITVPSL